MTTPRFKSTSGPQFTPSPDATTGLVLFVGYNAAYLRAIDGQLPSNSVVVIEEPDIIRKRELHHATERFDCLAEIIPAKYQQSSDCLDVAVSLASARPVAAVVPGLEYAVLGAAAVAAELGLPGASVAAAQALGDKIRLREVAGAGGVHNPRWREVHGPRDILDFAGDGPVVVKPANRQASVGVQLFDRVDRATADQAWAYTVAASEYEQVPDRTLAWRFLAEERLVGPEYSVEVLVRGGEVIFENVTQKTVISGPYPVELGHLLPAPLEPAQRAAFSTAIRTMIAALGFQTGMLHAEWILTAAGPALVECAGRCPGDHLMDLLDLAYDTRLRVSLIELLSGSELALPGDAARAAAIRFLSADLGVVQEISGVEQSRGLPGVQELEVDLAVGAAVSSWNSSWNRAGHVIATGPNPASAYQRTLNAAASVSIRTDPR